MKNLIILITAAVILFSGCSAADAAQEKIGSQDISQTNILSQTTAQENITETKADINGEEAATLLYMGQASVRIVTAENNVIYIDPYAGDQYDLPADLILVTHAHFDHNQISKVEKRNPDCIIITQDEALANGEHQVFNLGYVTVEAVEAGYNDWHDITDSVGYVLTFSSNGMSVYVTGDTSATEQMPLLAEKEIDYAFFCCDGVFNMGLEEAAWCAEQVRAKHNIPYHMTTNTENNGFDRSIAERFEVENLLIIEDGEEIKIE